jgi:hypothetical protein
VARGSGKTQSTFVNVTMYSKYNNNDNKNKVLTKKQKKKTPIK